MAVADPLILHANRLALLDTIPLPPQPLNNTADEVYRTYQIKDLKCSENAWLIFNTTKVVKILRPYDDCRYSLKERQNRHKCLLEGLEWNRKFTRDVHLGLARFCRLNLSQNIPSITLGKILKNPKLDALDPEAEYALVMDKLPKENRLDLLLKNSNSDSRQYYRDKLVYFLANIHNNPNFSSVEPDGNKSWGSTAQLKEKLISNLVSVEKPDTPHKDILNTYFYRSLLSACKSVRKTLLPILTTNKYSQLQQYFIERVQKQQIKRCHGDLKSRNIWIIDDSDYSQSILRSGVFALDAVDFNPDFCNIDTLSDFAMLVADIHTRTGSPAFASSLIEDYLSLTKQDDKGSRFVLHYYLVEKAFVGALVSILYDDESGLGLDYLKATKRYLNELQSLLN